MGSKIYTKKGDAGDTYLFNGTKVRKDDARVRAYGDVDELNSFIGWAMTAVDDKVVRETLGGIQKDLFAVGAQLADPSYGTRKAKDKTRIDEARVASFEKLIDRYEEATGPVRVFLLPGGCPGASAVHILRSVCRRAERDIVALSRAAEVPAILVKYVNRLSDLFFAMARYLNHQAGIPEVPWK
jgi:cob(I)alamin adenosyltransferase